jgi:outer membrane assembly lipoprotein YfiO
MLKQSFRLTLMYIAFVGIAGFIAWGMIPQESLATSDETLYETGMKYLENDQFEKARLAFQSLIDSYPDSNLAASSYLAIGATYYEEGGTENLQRAIENYKNFLVFFPRGPKAPDAQMKIISANMKMMGAPDRDREYTLRAEQAAMRFLEQYPDSEYAPIIRKMLENFQENLNKYEQSDTQNDQHNTK